MKRFPTTPDVATVMVADRLDRLAMKAEAISLAIHGVMEICDAPLAEPVAVLADELRAELSELSKEIHPRQG